MSESNNGSQQQAELSPVQKTPFYQKHLDIGGKMVDFGGWMLPVNYGSQIDEHHCVRNNCGVFDVSHMTVSDITGSQTLDFLSKLLANDIEKIRGVEGKALYSCMLNEQGGVIDDLIVYYLNDQHCRIVSNAGTRDKDIAWMMEQAQAFDAQVAEKPGLALLAIQGPKALQVCANSLNSESCGVNMAQLIDGLERFQGAFSEDNALFVGRTGYTGEDGLELIAEASLLLDMWDALQAADVQACGLGARDTLRLEAGMALYGNDLDEQHTPLDSGLKWTVSLSDNRDFIGKTALLAPVKNKMVGLILVDKGVLRGHQTLHFKGEEIGEISSGTFSPTLQQSIALARVNAKTKLAVGDAIQVQVRNRMLEARVAKYPFIRNGKATN